MSFLTPIFALAGVLLVAIPVAIHLLNRRRYKTVRWAAMEFLLRAMKKNRRRLRFESWLLLAARCLLVLLVGLALARPLGCGAGGAALAGLAGGGGLHVVVVDNSASMAYQGGREESSTNLDHAKRLAAGLIGRLGGGGERVALVTLGGEAAAVFDGFTYDLDAAAEAAGAVPQTAAGGDLAGALRAAADLAEGADATVKNLHLITDATAGAFPEDGPLAEAATAAAEVFTNVTHHDVSAATPWNHAVTGLGAEGGLLRAGFDTTLAADVRGYGSAPADRRTAAARVLIDGSPVAGERQVEPSPEAPPLRVTPDLSAGGTHTVTAELLRGDDLPIDDRRQAVLDVAAGLPVLIVEGERGMGALEGSGAFLDVALAPPAVDEFGTTGGSGSYVTTERISDLELGNKILGEYRAVFLAGVGGVGRADGRGAGGVRRGRGGRCSC